MAVNPTSVNMRNCLLKYSEKTDLVENVWPANLRWFVYVSTNYVETIKKLDSNRYVQLSRWSRVNATECGARGFVSESRLWQGFVCLLFCFVVVWFLRVCPKH